MYVDDVKHPTNAMLVYDKGMLVVFGGLCEGDNVKEYFKKLPKKSGFLYTNDKWKLLIKEHFGDKLRFQDRIKVSSANLDLETVKKLKTKIPIGYEIVKITDEVIDKLNERTLRKIDRFCGSIDNFRKNGIGFCVLHNGEVVGEITNGGVPYKKAFEIDIEVHPDYRRKGLATVLAAYMIEYSLENGLDPRWDAANKPSADLGLKLGYTDPEEHKVMIYIEEQK